MYSQSGNTGKGVSFLFGTPAIAAAVYYSIYSSVYLAGIRFTTGLVFYMMLRYVRRTYRILVYTWYGLSGLPGTWYIRRVPVPGSTVPVSRRRVHTASSSGAGRPWYSILWRIILFCSCLLLNLALFYFSINTFRYQSLLPGLLSVYCYSLGIMADSPRDSASHAIVYAAYDLKTTSVPEGFALPSSIDTLLAKKVPIHTFKREHEVKCSWSICMLLSLR